MTVSDMSEACIRFPRFHIDGALENVNFLHVALLQEVHFNNKKKKRMKQFVSFQCEQFSHTDSLVDVNLIQYCH